MPDDFIKEVAGSLESQLAEAKANLEKLHKLITFAREAGLDVTEHLARARELENKIKKLEHAIELAKSGKL